MPLGLIFDGYVDEPACLGVPPYVSPYVRYCAGVLRYFDYDVAYYTCDQWRKDPKSVEEALAEADIIAIIAGLSVPGRYRGGSPLLLSELQKIANLSRRGLLFLGGPIASGYVLRGGRDALTIYLNEVDCLVTGDIDEVLYHYLSRREIISHLRRGYGNVNIWSRLGSEVVKLHPWYPWIMAEIELSRGCDQVGAPCSFCTEGTSGEFEERPISDVIEEMKALYKAGVKAFRFGKCANILTYQGTLSSKGRRPNPKALEELYKNALESCPKLSVLHTDNANPKTIVDFPEESAEAIEIISKHNTEGDVLSFGIENLDPIVRNINNLKVDFEEALFAVRLVNEVGGWRPTKRSLPKILPGLNFIVGLAGDNDESLKIHSKFLRCILEEGLIVRRINIRKPMVFEKTPLKTLLTMYPSKVKESRYRKWKEWVRSEIDQPMLRRVAPLGCIVKDLRIEEKVGKLAFGRQLATYPLLVGVVDETLPVGAVLTTAVTDHGRRSVTGIPFPLDINNCPSSSLTAIPGIGKARASRIVQKRPYASLEKLKEAVDDEIILNVLELFAPFNKFLTCQNRAEHDD